jgi:hypothetical protein
MLASLLDLFKLKVTVHTCTQLRCHRCLEGKCRGSALLRFCAGLQVRGRAGSQESQLRKQAGFGT